MNGNTAYLLWGPERYLINQKIEELVAGMSTIGEPPEVLYVDGDESSPSELGQILEFSPLFAMSRIVMIRNPNWLGKSPRGAKKMERYRQVFEDYFQHDYQGQILVLTAEENNSANPITKMLQKHARVINIKPLAARDLEKWSLEELEKRGVRVAPPVLNRISSSGQDMYYLENMFDKLSLLNREELWNVAEIDAHLDSCQEISVFKLIDALLNRNVRASLDAFSQLMEQGQSHLMILAMIIQQFVTYSKVKFYIEADYDIPRIAQATGFKDFSIRKMRDKSSKFSPEEVRRVFEILLEVDTTFKSASKDPRIVMETLLVDICSRL